MFECSFHQLRENTSSQQRAASRDIYQNHHKTAYQLAQKHPLILDTNVLLGFYQLPYEAQKALKSFVLENQSRIYCSPQIIQEFDRNYASVQKAGNDLILIEASIHKFKSTESALKNYFAENEALLEAYPNFKQGIINNLVEVQQNAPKFVKKSTHKTEALGRFWKDIEWYNIVHQLPLIPALSKSTTRQLKLDFDALQAGILAQLLDSSEMQFKYFFSKNPIQKFPGYADLLKKSLNPYGDFIIYHEILHWIQSTATEVPPVFLTNDIAKGDWMDEKKRPYWHYLEHMYQNCQQVFFIFHAADCFENYTKTSFQLLLNPSQMIEGLKQAFFDYRQNLDSEKIHPKNLQTLFQKIYPLRQAVLFNESEWAENINNLEHEFGLKSIQNLEDDLLDNYTRLVDYELEHFCYFNQLEAMLQTLDLIFE